MTARTRHIYTVVRFQDTNNLNEAAEEIRNMEDELGEYLYGGVGCGEEKISVKLEYYDEAHKRWIEIKT